MKVIYFYCVFITIDGEGVNESFQLTAARIIQFQLKWWIIIVDTLKSRRRPFLKHGIHGSTSAPARSTLHCCSQPPQREQSVPEASQFHDDTDLERFALRRHGAQLFLQNRLSTQDVVLRSGLQEIAEERDHPQSEFANQRHGHYVILPRRFRRLWRSARTPGRYHNFFLKATVDQFNGLTTELITWRTSTNFDQILKVSYQMLVLVTKNCQLSINSYMIELTLMIELKFNNWMEELARHNCCNKVSCYSLHELLLFC